jgi:selenocysteine lyase/cysteine desulfurase
VTHLNNAGAALVPRVVTEAITEHLRLEQEVGGYEAAESQTDAFHASYEALAGVLGCRALNIALVQNSTVAFAQALSAFDLQPGNVVLTSRSDYASNQIMYLSLARRRGVEIVRAPDAVEGGIDPDEVRKLVRRHRPTLVALTWIPTNSGLVQPVKAVGKICRDAGVPYLVDACQAVGQLPIDVEDIHCDFLSATARKFLRGPRGLGFLFVADRMLDSGAHPLLIDMHGATWAETDRFVLTPDARRFETWETNYAGKIGLGVAADYALGWGLDAIEVRVTALAEGLRARLREVPGVTVRDEGVQRCGIVTFTVDGVPATDVRGRLRAAGINTSVSPMEYARFDLAARGLPDVVRASVHYYNTEDELDRLCAALPRP